MRKMAFTLFIASFLFRCGNHDHAINSFVAKNDTEFNDKTIDPAAHFSLDGDMKFNQQGRDSTINWNTYLSIDKQILFSIPSNWQLKNSSNSIIFADIGEDEYSFYTLLVHSKSEKNISLERYKDLLLETCTNDSMENCVISESGWFLNTSRKSYSFKLDSRLRERDYESFIIITENANYIFDFTMRLAKEDKDNFSLLIFNLAVHTLHLNGAPMFKPESRSVNWE